MALPDIETLKANFKFCSRCHLFSLATRRTDNNGRLVADCENCHRTNEPTDRKWFYWFCFPGCLSEPIGPFDTQAEALADAQAKHTKLIHGAAVKIAGACWMDSYAEGDGTLADKLRRCAAAPGLGSDGDLRPTDRDALLRLAEKAEEAEKWKVRQS